MNYYPKYIVVNFNYFALQLTSWCVCMWLLKTVSILNITDIN